MENQLPEISCLAVLDDVVRDRLIEGELKLGPIAKFTTGAVIEIDGIFKGKGMYGFKGIRWHSGDKKGLFGRGIALYGRPFEVPPNLPIVK